MDTPQNTRAALISKWELALNNHRAAVAEVESAYNAQDYKKMGEAYDKHIETHAALKKAHADASAAL